MVRTETFDLQTLARYRITLSYVGQGTASCAPTTCCSANGCNKNTQVTLTATPAEGWFFESWSGGYTGTTNPAVFLITQNMAITVTFVQHSTLSEISSYTYRTNDPATGEPWLPGQTNANISTITIRNIGTWPGLLSWQCYAYANQTGEYLLIEGTSAAPVNPGDSISQDMIVTIPDVEGATIPIGIKVRGESETWPTWELGLQNGKALIFGSAGLGTATIALIAVGVIGAIGLLWFISRKRRKR